MAEYVRDTFTRVSASGWGTSEVGGAWSQDLSNSVTAIAISGIGADSGRVSWNTHALAARADMRLASATAARDVIASLSFTAPASWFTVAGWAGASVWLLLRVSGAAGAPTGYYGRANVKPDGSMLLDTGVMTAGVPATALNSITYAAGTVVTGQLWRLEARAIGSAATKLGVRVYRPAAGIPAGNLGWLNADDDTAGMGVAGVHAIRVNRPAPPSDPGQIVDIPDYYVSDYAAPDFSYTATALAATFATTGTTGDFTAYSWSWGDGTTAGTGATPTHTYGAAGTYAVTLTGTTRWGSTFSTTGAVSVAAPLPAPPELLPVVLIGNPAVNVCADVYSLTWNLGRDSWFTPIAGQTCSIRLRGTPTFAIGAPVTISVPNAAGGQALWVGTVDQVSEVNDPVDARDESLVTAMDVASRLARQHLVGGSILPTAKLPARLDDLRPTTGVKYRYRYGAAAVWAGRWLDLALKVKADKLGQRTYLELVADALTASFAFGYSSRDGAIAYAPIEAPTGLASTPRIDLNTGIDCASRVTLDRNNLDGMINRWEAAAGTTDVDWEASKRESIDTFGERSYSVAGDVMVHSPDFPVAIQRFAVPDGLIDRLADPIRGAEVEVPVTDWAQSVITASPLDFATWNAKVYSIVGIRHEVTVGDAWRTTLRLDRNPWEMDGRAVP